MAYNLGKKVLHICMLGKKILSSEVLGKKFLPKPNHLSPAPLKVKWSAPYHPRSNLPYNK